MDQPTIQLDGELVDRPAEAVQPQSAGDADLLLANIQRLAGIGMLTAGVAQELANLLSIVTTASISLRHELQLENSATDDTIQHYINLIERNAFRSARIVAMLQEYGSPAAPQMAITDIETVLRDTLMLVERQFRAECNIRIEVNAPGESQSIVCDHNRIVQVLVNLLLNARDAMKETGGLIEVKVQPVGRDDTVILPGMDGRLNGTGDRVAISISDERQEISTAEKDPLFKPFFSAKPGGNGVGLGLSIAQQIVEQHQGDIWYSNSKGPTEGASVTIVLPLRPAG